MPFGDNEVRSYFQKIGRIVFAHAERELVSLTDRFMAEAKRHASDLIQTPLLLSLIIYLFNSTNRIPDNRLEIYQQCAKMLFVEWDRDRAIDPELVQQHRLMQLLPVLAGEIYTDPELASSVPISWLKHRVASFFKGVLGPNDQGRSDDAADQFVSHLTGRAWVLTEKAPGKFEFTHRTFLEYFFAKHLDDHHETVDDLIRELLGRLKTREWTAPAHIALQLKSERGLSFQNKCAQALLDGINAAATEDRANLLLFTAEAVEYLQPAEPLLRRIAYLIVINAEDESYWSSAFLSLLQVESGLQQAVYGGVADGVVELLSTYKGQVLSPTVDWLLALRLTAKGYLGATKSPWLDRAPDASDRVAEALSHRIDLSEIVLPFTLKAVFDLTGKISDQHEALYNHLIWSISVSSGRFLDLLLMRDELLKVQYGKLALGDAAYARLALLLQKNTDWTKPTRLETGTIVHAKLRAPEADPADASSIAGPLASAYRLVTAALCELAAVLPTLRSFALPRPSNEEAPVFEIVSRRARKTIAVEDILESYLARREV